MEKKEEVEKKVVDNNGEGEGEGQDLNKKPETDAFGVEDTTPPAKKEEGDKNKKADTNSGAYDAIPVDHPVIKGLQDQVTKLSEDKGSMGANLSKQNEIIKNMEKTINDLKEGKIDLKGVEADVLFKDIKWSKDLTAEEREDMTETEIKQMDIIADMQTKQNQMYAENQKKEKENQNKVAEDVNSTVKSHASELAKGEDGKVNVDMANQIIESFKALSFNIEGKTAEDIKKLVEISAGQVPNYKAPKEQTTVKTKTVTDTKTGDDPFNIDDIVDEATKPANGNYSL